MDELNFKFVQSDAGRSKSKRSKQKNDCTVRAVVETVGLPYDEVYDILAEAGRKCGRGFDFKTWAPTVEINGYVFKWISFPAVKGQRRMNPVDFCMRYRTGKYIARTAGHVMAVVDGAIRDTSPPYDERCIYGAFEVIKKGS